MTGKELISQVATLAHRYFPEGPNSLSSFLSDLQTLEDALPILSPCPFCGRPPHRTVRDFPEIGVIRVCCSNVSCGVRGPIVDYSMSYSEKEEVEAMRRWNVPLRTNKHPSTTICNCPVSLRQYTKHLPYCPCYPQTEVLGSLGGPCTCPLKETTVSTDHASHCPRHSKWSTSSQTNEKHPKTIICPQCRTPNQEPSDDTMYKCYRCQFNFLTDLTKCFHCKVIGTHTLIGTEGFARHFICNACNEPFWR